MDIFMIGYAGVRGTAQLIGRRRAYLETLLPGALLQEALAMDRAYPVPDACLPYARVQTGEGGVLTALQHLSRKLQSTLWIDLRKLPIRQETVEICALLGLDPCALAGAGTWLIAVQDGAAALAACRFRKIPACAVGRTVPGPAGRVVYGTRQADPIKETFTQDKGNRPASFRDDRRAEGGKR